MPQERSESAREQWTALNESDQSKHVTKSQVGFHWYNVKNHPSTHLWMLSNTDVSNYFYSSTRGMHLPVYTRIYWATRRVQLRNATTTATPTTNTEHSTRIMRGWKTRQLQSCKINGRRRKPEETCYGKEKGRRTKEEDILIGRRAKAERNQK